jgi:uncharacterized membrane protein YozB (DUF420 family)
MNPAIKLVLAALGAVAMLAGATFWGVCFGLWTWAHGGATAHKEPLLIAAFFGAAFLLNLALAGTVRYFMRKPKGWSAIGITRDLFIGMLLIPWFLVVIGVTLVSILGK